MTESDMSDNKTRALYLVGELTNCVAAKTYDFDRVAAELRSAIKDLAEDRDYRVSVQAIKASRAEKQVADLEKKLRQDKDTEMSKAIICLSNISIHEQHNGKRWLATETGSPLLGCANLGEIEGPPLQGLDKNKTYRVQIYIIEQLTDEEYIELFEYDSTKSIDEQLTAFQIYAQVDIKEAQRIMLLAAKKVSSQFEVEVLEDYFAAQVIK